MTRQDVKTVSILCLAATIAFVPPVWAVLSEVVGMQTGAVALICGGLYVVNGNVREDAFKILMGLFADILCALTVIAGMTFTPFPAPITLYVLLCILGGGAVLFGDRFSNVVYTPSIFCGWAICLAVMGDKPVTELGLLPLEMAFSMAIGVYYVGVLVDLIHRWLVKKFSVAKSVAE